MSTQQTYAFNSERPFIADPHSVMRTGGAQISWADWADTYKNTEGNKALPAGTVCAIDATTKALEPPTATTAANATLLLATPATENSDTDSLSGYGTIVGGVIYSNLLPDTAHADFANMITVLETTGPGFRFETYGDSRDA